MGRVVRKSRSEIEKMRDAGKLAAETLAYAIGLVKPGVTTGYIDNKVDSFIRKHNAVPAPLGYGETRNRPAFPKSICTSVNEVICHGIPGKRELKEGDIICIDVTVILDGFHGDNATTVPVGNVGDEARALMRGTLESLRRGIEAARNGAKLLDVGRAIQTYAESLGYGVVEDFVGHGLGRKFHEEPQVPHVAESRGAGGGRTPNPTLKPGMTFTIEPMINAGTWRSEPLPDGWTAITADRSLSAQYEHTILVVEKGPPEILTQMPGTKSWAPAGYEP